MLRVIVSGLIAQYPLGGVMWDYLQYVLGLARLGHDVHYIEDTGQWPYNPLCGGLTGDCSFNVEYLAGVMARFGLAQSWACRLPVPLPSPDPRGLEWRWFGLAEQQRRRVIDSADLWVDVSCSLQRPADYRQVPRLACVDTDPVFTQIRLAAGQEAFREQIDAYDVLFSYGECFSDAVPATGHRWRPLRTPIVLSEWRPTPPRREVFTTVMNWTSYEDATYRGQSYGQKDVEFERFLELPRLVAPTVLELAVGEGKTRRLPRDRLLSKGWRLVDPAEVCADLDSYRSYIQSSKAEWSVAKNGYVLGQAGWFSGRTACYLAAGKPVVVQDTGFAPVIPIGEGILVFRTLEEAAMGIREVQGHYTRHAKAARLIAEEYFDSEKVLGRLIEGAFDGHD